MFFLYIDIIIIIAIINSIISIIFIIIHFNLLLDETLRFNIDEPLLAITTMIIGCINGHGCILDACHIWRFVFFLSIRYHLNAPCVFAFQNIYVFFLQHMKPLPKERIKINNITYWHASSSSIIHHPSSRSKFVFVFAQKATK